MQTTNIIHKQILNPDVMDEEERLWGNIDQIREDVWILRVFKKDNLILSVVIVEESEFECSARAMIKVNSNTINLKDIIFLKPLVQFLEFRYLYFQRSIGGKVVKVRI